MQKYQAHRFELILNFRLYTLTFGLVQRSIDFKKAVPYLTRFDGIEKYR